jgi:outer membrane protein OmpA-like peptidoglycan-associated protein
MKLHAIAPALAALLATACAANTHPASAPERAEQAEQAKQKAEVEARQARIDAEKARIEAQDAARAQHEAEAKARYAEANAAQAERDAQLSQAVGVAEPQPQPQPPPVAIAANPGPNRSVTFSAASADLDGSDKARLDELADDARAHPSQKVVITAYSDDSGDAAKDAKLSQRRADAVAHYLESKGVSDDRIATKVGAPRVVYVGKDDAHRSAPNRGVEIVIK